MSVSELHSTRLQAENMAKARTIFERQKLKPSQLRTVADRRLGDARFLQKSGLNARANGAMYLGGFVVECLLKANLLEEHPWLQNAGSPSGHRESDRALWFLCYRWHDLDGILARLPRLTERLASAGQRGQTRMLQSLKSICAQWTIQARYSPQMTTVQDADKFISRIEEVRPWLIR